MLSAYPFWYFGKVSLIGGTGNTWFAGEVFIVEFITEIIACKNLRLHASRTFFNLVYYIYDEHQTIVIISIYHHKRNPAGKYHKTKRK